MPAVAKKKQVEGRAPIPVRFGKDEERLLRLITARASAQSRSVSGQIKHYARLGLIAEDNPDLPLSLIAGIMQAREELKQGLAVPYEWGVLAHEPPNAGDQVDDKKA